MRRRAAAGALAVAVALACAGCTSSGSGGGGSGGQKSDSTTTSPDSSAPGGLQAMSPKGVAALVSKTFSTNNKANHNLDSTLLATYESGSAYAIDAAQYAMAKLAHQPGYSPFGIRVRSAAVPRSPGDPDDFAVLGVSYPIGSSGPLETPSCSYVDPLLVFEQTGAGSSWRISLEPSVDSRVIGKFPASTNGYAPDPSSSAQAAARAVPAAVATALEHYEATGVLGALSRGDFTGKCWALPDPRADFEGAQQQKISSRELYTQTGSMAAFALSGGRTLVTFTLADTQQLVPDDASFSIAWKSQSSVLPSYLLKTGDYSQITEHSEVEVAAVIPPHGSTYSVVGAYSGWTSITGTRSSAPPRGSTGTTGPSGQLDSLRLSDS